MSLPSLSFLLIDKPINIFFTLAPLFCVSKINCMKQKSKIILVFCLLSSISLSVFSSKKDSLIDILKNGEDFQKTSAFYRLADMSKNKEFSMSYFDSAMYYHQLNPNDTDLMLLCGFKAMCSAKHKDYAEAIILCKKSIEISDRIGMQKDKAAMTKYLGAVFNRMHSYDSSMHYTLMAIDEYNLMLIEDEYPKEFCLGKLAALKDQMGKQLFRQGDYESAIEYMYDGLRDYESIERYTKSANIHLNIGSIYYFNKDYDKAFTEYKKCIELSKGVKKGNLLNNAYTNIGSIYLSKKEYDSALYYFNKTLALKLEKSKYSVSVAGLYSNKGIIYKHLQQYDTALSYFNKALEIQKKIDYKFGEAKTKANIGLTYVEMGNYSLGQKYLLDALSFTKTQKMGESTKEIYLGLYAIYNKKGNFKESLKYYQLYVTYKDSINSVEVSKKINEYKEQYEAEKKDREIEQLQQENQVQVLTAEKQIAENKRQKVIAISLGTLAVLLILIIIAIQRYFKFRQSAAKEMMKKNEEISQQKIVDLVKGNEVSSINSYMEGQEKERGRIAGELHDRLGSLLSTVKLHFSSIESTIEQDIEQSESFSFALDLLDNSVEEVRTISHNLSKGVLTRFGLIGAVENLKNAINAAGKIQVKFIKAGPEFDILPEIEIELFRIIQELITNAIKHSQSEDIFVQLISDQEGLSIVVEDHGLGMDMTKMKSKGLGLKNLKLRVENIGGEYHIDTAINKGTSVIINVKNT